jgi:hypothetical protein
MAQVEHVAVVLLVLPVVRSDTASVNWPFA